MKVNWKFMRICWLPAAILLLTGCGGFSASRSVSPATFFLPGLGKASIPAPVPDEVVPVHTPATVLAKSN